MNNTASSGINAQADAQPPALLCGTSGINLPMWPFVSAVLLSAAAAFAAPSLSLGVIGPSSIVDIHGLAVKAILRNTGDGTLKLLNDPRTVLSTAQTNTFHISSASGSPTFTGIKVKFVPSVGVALNREGTFTVLAPGESIEITHDLAGVYNFTLTGEGLYHFSAANTFNYVDATGVLKIIRANTYSHQFKLAGKLAANSGYTHILSEREVTYTGCNEVQKAQILAAAIASNDYVAEVNRYLAGISANNTSERYTTWFGKFTTERYNAVAGRFGKIGTDATSNNYDCTTCPATRGFLSSMSYGYVNAEHSPGKIYLCGAFWTAPL
ncbi:hypothetical protein FRC08_018707 [Ceratobasidium sp. 394]|nr:hypothetical protein FRC08_018707 [Ceratobasidium sp. 394]KAG9095220.1 hypothetical protein FS749_010850 [Ceratobasidium sp. UAMH 11750]